MLSINEGYRLKPRHPALAFAVREGHTEVVNALVMLPNVQTNTVTEYKQTLMHLAVRARHLDVVRILAAIPNFEFDTFDWFSYKPIHIAACLGDTETVIFLASLPSVDINAPSNRGWTLLHFAAKHGNLDVVKYLVTVPGIDLGARAGSTNRAEAKFENGWPNLTASSLAKRGGHKRVYKFLKRVQSEQQSSRHMRTNRSMCTLM